LVRVGVGPVAAGFAAFAISFSCYLWLTRDSEPANDELRAEASDSSVTGSIYAKAVDLDTAAARSDIRDSFRARFASLNTVDEVEFALSDNRSEPLLRSSFGERFAFDRDSAPWSLQTADASTSFDDRFGGEGLNPSTAVRTEAVPRVAGPRVASAAVVPVPRPAARSVVAQAAQPAAPKRQQSGFQLASADTSLPLGYAPTDSVKSSLNGLPAKDADPSADDMSHTAIYDITARTVYLPNGRRLEAHSGLGDHMDDPRYVNQRMSGPTPPNVYDLKMRESLFHGVKAIRLIPKDQSKMHGRAGILAHTYMLGPNGQSNGCVSFSNYDAFLEAYERGDVTRLVVVEHLAEAPAPKTAADWLKDLFRRS
jgi:Protein of unknown function (DUF2778)